MKSWMSRQYHRASALNLENIRASIGEEAGGSGRLLDLGCDDGKWTSELARRMGASSVAGIEIVEPRAREAAARGIEVARADLNGRLPLDSGSFDVVHANQVIEHLHDLDTFIEEIFRVLKPGGAAVISTENGSSWHNIAAALLGWQIFSLTNFSKKRSGVGNPLAIHRSETLEFGTWTHKVIFNYRGLKEFFELYGFTDVRIAGAGYYPLPARFGRIDARHAHFLTLKARKPRL